MPSLSTRKSLLPPSSLKTVSASWINIRFSRPPAAPVLITSSDPPPLPPYIPSICRLTPGVLASAVSNSMRPITWSATTAVSVSLNLNALLTPVEVFVPVITTWPASPPAASRIISPFTSIVKSPFTASLAVPTWATDIVTAVRLLPLVSTPANLICPKASAFAVAAFVPIVLLPDLANFKSATVPSDVW